MAGRHQDLPPPANPHVPEETAGFRGAGPDGVLPHVSSREKDVVIPSAGRYLRRAYLPTFTPPGNWQGFLLCGETMRHWPGGAAP